jgi:hypothetical protein
MNKCWEMLTVVDGPHSDRSGQYAEVRVDGVCVDVLLEQVHTGRKGKMLGAVQDSMVLITLTDTSIGYPLPRRLKPHLIAAIIDYAARELVRIRAEIDLLANAEE